MGIFGLNYRILYFSVGPLLVPPVQYTIRRGIDSIMNFTFVFMKSYLIIHFPAFCRTFSFCRASSKTMHAANSAYSRGATWLNSLRVASDWLVSLHHMRDSRVVGLSEFIVIEQPGYLIFRLKFALSFDLYWTFRPKCDICGSNSRVSMFGVPSLSFRSQASM